MKQLTWFSTSVGLDGASVIMDWSGTDWTKRTKKESYITTFGTPILLNKFRLRLL